MPVLSPVAFLVYISETVPETLKKVKPIPYNKHRITELLIDILHEKVHLHMCLLIIHTLYVEV